MPAKRTPLFWCQECGKKFYTVKAAERAAFGDNGCPKCGGSDIDAGPPSEVGSSASAYGQEREN